MWAANGLSGRQVQKQLCGLPFYSPGAAASAGLILPFFFQPGGEERMIDTERGDRGFAASQLGGISSAAAGGADRSVMAELKVEGLRPGFALFV